MPLAYSGAGEWKSNLGQTGTPAKQMVRSQSQKR
jgi:hypothetical protein